MKDLLLIGIAIWLYRNYNRKTDAVTSTDITSSVTDKGLFNTDWNESSVRNNNI